MPRITRRKFLKDSAVAGVGTAFASAGLLSAPTILTRSRGTKFNGQGELIFRPHYVQSGRGPHLLDWAYASDERWDAFHSNVAATKDRVTISDTEGKKKFGINVRWNVEGFGYTFITADNGGELYELPPSGKAATLNLNLELARSRVVRNGKRLALFGSEGWKPSREVQALLDLSQEYLADAMRGTADGARCGELSQRSLLHALWAGEKMEVEHAQHQIADRGTRDGFFFGCDARSMLHMHTDLFMERFSDVFNYATVTHVWQENDVMEDFEPAEGKLQFEVRDMMVRKLRAKGLAVEGRPLYWFHTWVTPDWIKKKTYDELLKYVERTTREVVSHYGDSMFAWEIVNELHDWANEVRLTPEQTVELTRLACDVAKATAPGVHRLVNNCCPYAEYVQLRRWSGQEATYPQRTPFQFTRDLVDAGVDFTLIGQQMYFPYRDLQDIVILLERYQEFRKPVHLSEVGASSGPTNDAIKSGKLKFSKDPYPWRRHWDEELQADWLESVYTLAYSKPFIEGVHWFDFVDPYYFIESGGLLRSTKGDTKAAYDRLKTMIAGWKGLKKGTGAR
jgi:endo-1,4-beta-xylanase